MSSLSCPFLVDTAWSSQRSGCIYLLPPPSRPPGCSAIACRRAAGFPAHTILDPPAIDFRYPRSTTPCRWLSLPLRQVLSLVVVVSSFPLCFLFPLPLGVLLYTRRLVVRFWLLFFFAPVPDPCDGVPAAGFGRQVHPKKHLGWYVGRHRAGVP